MAIFTTGPIVAGVSGKVGSVVFVNSKRSRTLRPAPLKLHDSSPFTARSKTWLSNVRRQWSVIPTAEQNAWRAAAAEILRTNRLGQKAPISGFEYFVMTHTRVFVGPREFLEGPPIPDVRDNTGSPTCVFSISTGLEITADNAFGPLLLRLQVYGWPFWVDHDTKALARFVFLDEFTLNPGLISFDLTTQWEQHFGTVQLGQRFACATKVRFSASPFVPMTIFRQEIIA